MGSPRGDLPDKCWEDGDTEPLRAWEALDSLWPAVGHTWLSAGMGAICGKEAQAPSALTRFWAWLAPGRGPAFL